MRPTIYQLFVRHFGNTNESVVTDGNIQQNGCGKFFDINSFALNEIKSMGFTHVWLTGVLEHMSLTSYPGIKEDDPLLVKGKAGSPYAIRDYFDVSADYAINYETRLNEFVDLIDRCHNCDLKVIIDFVPNHVGRSYLSDINPELNFGDNDDVSLFFDRNNNFYYIQEEGAMHLPGGEYAFEGVNRVTGNNAITRYPSTNDWFETVKLNYGHDFTKGSDTRKLPGMKAQLDEVPVTWIKMDSILAYWQSNGVDGFRCDMAHMVPLEFWAWACRRARERNRGCYFMAEAYDNDPAKLTCENVLEKLMDVGFDTVYDGESYEIIKNVIEYNRNVTDLDAVIWAEKRLSTMLRYAENHDEVRLASHQHWGGHGAQMGKTVTAFLSAVGTGPFMLYNGQEVGESGDGVEGFSKDDGRSSIFDYGNLPILSKWVNKGAYDGGALTDSQRELREWYCEWFNLMQNPAFTCGGVYGLNTANHSNTNFRAGASPVGHSVYAFIRHDRDSNQAYLVVLNFSAEEEVTDLDIIIPIEAKAWLQSEIHDSVYVGEVEPCGIFTTRLEL